MVNKEQTIEEEEGIKLQCPNPICAYIWLYKGKNPFLASCPYCKGSVRIEKNKVV